VVYACATPRLILRKGGVDILLLDMGLPDEHGLGAVPRAGCAAPSVPIIVLTGLDDEALAAEAMKEGAQDYLIGSVASFKCRRVCCRASVVRS
jgi:DNA-binding NarL/FixJ family response regulator